MGDIQIQQLQAELERMRNSEGGSSFNDLVQRMMFKCGVTRIGPLTNEELVNEIDSAFASSAAGGIMDRKTFHDVINSKKLMELRLQSSSPRSKPTTGWNPRLRMEVTMTKCPAETSPRSTPLNKLCICDRS